MVVILHVVDDPRPRITSTSNPRFRAAIGLREARERRRQGRILVDGIREIGRALDSGVRPVEAWLDPERVAGSPDLLAMRDRLDKEGGCALLEADARIIDRLAYGERTDGLVLVAETPVATLAGLALPAEPLVVVLEAIEKPGNLGAVLRSADGAGAAAVIVADGRTDPFNPNVIRASVGTVFTVPIAAASGAETLSWLRQHELRIVTARVDDGVLYTTIDLTGPLALVLGSEATGLSDHWTGPESTAVRVPMTGVADSLNVSATAAVLLYEALRQRQAVVPRPSEP